MGLLDEIQNEAVSANSSVTSLLRKCLVLAARMDADLLEDWVKHELNGYGPGIEVPDYRRIEMQFKGNFVGGFGAQISNAPVPPRVVRYITKDPDISMFKARQPISTIDTSGKTRDAGVLVVNLDNLSLSLSNKVFEGYNALQFWGEVPSMGVVGIVEAVKTRVLDFALSLAKRYPEAGEIGGMAVSDEASKRDLKNIIQATIYGPVGVLGSATESTVTVSVNAGNLPELRDEMERHGVPSADLVELEQALKIEPEMNGKNFGPRVGAWISKMVGKAASGAWGVSLTAGGALLEAALLAYYGYK